MHLLNLILKRQPLLAPQVLLCLFFLFLTFLGGGIVVVPVVSAAAEESSSDPAFEQCLRCLEFGEYLKVVGNGNVKKCTKKCIAEQADPSPEFLLDPPLEEAQCEKFGQTKN
mmetsp:Transcript_27317/g.29466  ORF Transcript_27317/g.29466 Transcript_27317/m.29466 type:complete len:112 (+) Transcript_27317:395-730(+)